MAKKTTQDDKTKRTYLGIDVSEPRRGYFLATLKVGDQIDSWRLEGLEQHGHEVEAEKTAWCTEEGMKEIREWSVDGRRGLDKVARATAADCEAVTAVFAEVIDDVGPDMVFIDSPPAFARNAVQHGRATEKADISRAEYEWVRQVPVQVTPSMYGDMVPHGGSWNSLLRGMMVFYAIRNGGEFDEESWVEYVKWGLKHEAKVDLPVKECNPTASVLAIRSSVRRREFVVKLLRKVEAEDEYKAVRVLEIVRAYITRGVASTKREAQLYNWADATVAALGCLPYEFSDDFEAYPIQGDEHDRWQSSERSIKSGHDQEGQIEVPLPKLGELKTQV